MSLTENATVDVDEILGRIQAEIARRDAGEESSSPGGHFSGEPYLPITRLSISAEDLQLRDSYHVGEFLCFHDDDFIDNVSRTLLGRQGLDYYLNALRHGRLTKIEILGRVNYSTEGRRRGVKVKGLLPMFLLHSSFRVPILGYILESAYYLLRLPMVVRNQRMLEERMAVMNRDLAAQSNQSIDQIERALEYAHRLHDGQ